MSINITATASAGSGHGHHHAAHGVAKPYVVSLDIHTLLDQWAVSSGFRIPDEALFRELRSEMRQQLLSIFPQVEMLTEDEIRVPLMRLARGTRLPIVSLDQTYCPSEHMLQLTRASKLDKTNAGMTHRSGSDTIEQQVRTMAKSVQGDVVLVDDVIFSGDMIAERIFPLLLQHGINVRVVVAGVGVGAGVALVSEVAEVKCVREYPRVIDEICERDFYPGVPLSGRTLLGHENTGMAYVLPYGDPISWASIPEKAVVPFSRFCLVQTYRLFREIEKASKRIVLIDELPRKVNAVGSGRGRFTDELVLAVDSL